MLYFWISCTWWYASGRHRRLLNFHVKSLARHSSARVGICSQNDGLENRRGMTPKNSFEKPILGATMPYTATNTSQMAMLPGMAMTWYFVQLLVTSAALPRTVSSTAPYMALPQTHLPAGMLSRCTPS